MNKKGLLNVLKEFRPSFIFLLKFFVSYGVLTLLYGLYLNTYGARPDPMTGFVSKHASYFLDLFVGEVQATPNPSRPRVFLILNEVKAVSVYEGCNGLNMMILFFAFIISFSGGLKKMAWFIPLGFLVIHIANILRISGLALISLEQPKYFYFFHKYLFTASIFIAIFLLWVIWVMKINPPSAKKEAAGA